MDDRRTEAQNFELSTPKIDLADALQAELSDSLSGFELQPAKPVTPQRPVRNPTRQDNDSVVAALMGKPLMTNPLTLAPATRNTTTQDTMTRDMATPAKTVLPPSPSTPLREVTAATKQSAIPFELPNPIYSFKTPANHPALDTEADAGETLIEAPRRMKLVSVLPPANVADEIPDDAPDANELSTRELSTFELPRFEFPPEQQRAIAARTEVKPIAVESADRPRTGAWWTLPLMFAGLAIVACAVLIPAADENRRATYELAKIDRDVAFFQKQSDVNKDFLQRVSNDPTLAERLALRQLHLTRTDTRLVPVPQKNEPFSRSPFALVSVEPPPALEPYRPVAGFLGEWFLNVRLQIYLAGAGLLLIAAGVILGGGEPTPVKSEEE